MGRVRLVILATLLAVGSVSMAADRPAVGGVDRVEGAATASFQHDARALDAGDAVYFRDLLATGDEARLQVLLGDGSTLRLGANARLLVDEFVYPPERGLSRLRLQVPAGAFQFRGGRVEEAPRSSVEIRTPAATLGIRGTLVWGGTLDDGDYGVLVLAGEVEVRNAAGAVVLGTGEGTRISAPGMPPTAAKRWADSLVRQAMATVSFPDE